VIPSMKGRPHRSEDATGLCQFDNRVVQIAPSAAQHRFIHSTLTYYLTVY
jgi:hypothetical protein